VERFRGAEARPHPQPETLRVTMSAGLREALRAGIGYSRSGLQICLGSRPLSTASSSCSQMDSGSLGAGSTFALPADSFRRTSLRIFWECHLFADRLEQVTHALPVREVNDERRYPSSAIGKKVISDRGLFSVSGRFELP
jgi:hypothetical protein